MSDNLEKPYYEKFLKEVDIEKAEYSDRFSKNDEPIILKEYDISALLDEDDVDLSSLAFSILSTEEIKKISVGEVTESKLQGPGTVYDEISGVIENYKECVTCGYTNKECPGHFMHIDLPTPIVHPLYKDEVLQYLNSFCSTCSRLMIKIKEMKLLNYFAFKGDNRFKAILDYTAKVKFCPHCTSHKYTYFISEGKFYEFLDDKTKKVHVTSEKIENVLGNIKSIDIERIGFNSTDIIPVNYILNRLLVLPICARPFVQSGNSFCDDDLTSKYIEIVKKVNKLKQNDDKTKKKKPLSEREIKETIDSLEFHIETLMDNSKGRAKQISGRALKCIRERMDGKGGLFRSHLSGKRSDFGARTVIDPDPSLRADEISIPEELAKKLTFPEKVFHGRSASNLLRMQELVNNNKANTVIRNGETINLGAFSASKVYCSSDGFVLEDGDIVIRQGKTIDPEKYKEKKGVNLQLQPGDKIARNNKILKNVKIGERFPFVLEPGDKIDRNGEYIDPEAMCKKGNFSLQNDDKVYRKGKLIGKLFVREARRFRLKHGDVVERHLRDEDIVLHGRQPTLHIGSMIARKIKVRKNNSYCNSGKPIRVIGMNLAQCNSLNADFDGDETNFYVPQSYEAAAELWILCSTQALIKSNQSSRLLSCICQDALMAGCLATKGIKIQCMENEKKVEKWFPFVPIPREDFFDAMTCITEMDGEKNPNKLTDRLLKKLDQIREVFRWKGIDKIIGEQTKAMRSMYRIQESYNGDLFSFNGHALFSLLLPDDFEYENEDTGVKIIRGVLISGMLSKASLGISPYSLVHKLEKEYGADAAVDFISNYQFLMNHYIKNRGFSIGIADFLPTREDEIKENIFKCFTVAQSIENTEKDNDVKEQKINYALNDATNIGKKISKESVAFDNSLNDQVKSGTKGSSINISQIMANVGQQNVEGKRIPKNYGSRTLPHYPTEFPSTDNISSEKARKIIIKKYESGGFVSNSYINGLNAQEAFFHAEGGREGIIDTGIKTAHSGYIQRKLVKKMEDYIQAYNGLVVDSKGNVIQFNSKHDFDPARLVLTDDGQSFINISNIIDKLNSNVEWDSHMEVVSAEKKKKAKQQKMERLAKKVDKSKKH